MQKTQIKTDFRNDKKTSETPHEKIRYTHLRMGSALIPKCQPDFYKIKRPCRLGQGRLNTGQIILRDAGNRNRRLRRRLRTPPKAVFRTEYRTNRRRRDRAYRKTVRPLLQC